MTHDKAPVPADMPIEGTAEKPENPDDLACGQVLDRVEAESAASAAPESATGQPEADQAHAGITFAGREGTAPIHTQDPAAASPASENAPHRLRRFGATPASGSNEIMPVADAMPIPENGIDESGVPPLAPPPPPVPPKPPLKPGLAENSFRAMSFLALLFLAVFLLLHTLTGIYFPALYLPFEVDTAGVAATTKNFGLWLTPNMGDLPAMFPAYFWFLGGVKALLDLAEKLLPVLAHLPADTIIFSVAACIAGLVAVSGAYTLGRATGLDRQTSFAAGLILLSCVGFTPLTHIISPDALLAGVMAFALAFLYKGWMTQCSFVRLGVGFALVGLSTLLGGLPGLLIPLLASLLFLCWRGTLRRGQRLDALLGFLFMLVIIGGWLGAVILLTKDSAYVHNLAQQLLTPLAPPLWPPKDPWWHSLALLCVGLLPWLLVLLFVSWGRVFATSWSSLKASRTDHAGSSWLWLNLFLGLLLLTAFTSKPWLSVVPLLPIAALLLARSLLQLSPSHSRIFYLLLAGLFLILGVALGLCGIPAVAAMAGAHLPPLLSAALKAVKGLPVLGAVCVIAAGVLWKLTNRSFPGGALAVTSLLAAMLAQPATLMLSPSLEGLAGERIQVERNTAPATEAVMPQPETSGAPEQAPATLSAPEAQDSQTTQEATEPIVPIPVEPTPTDATAPAATPQTPVIPEQTEQATEPIVPVEPAPAPKPAESAPAQEAPAPDVQATEPIVPIAPEQAPAQP